LKTGELDPEEVCMANVDYFLRIDGIPGESTDDKHKGEIDVESFSWSEQAGVSAGGGGGGRTGKVSMQDFHFVARTSKASPKLLVACASGEHIKSAVLTGSTAQKINVEFLTVSFSDVLISSYAIGASQNDLPVDQFSLNFARISMQYKVQLPDGTVGDTVTGGWDRKANKQL
jgi:type VI secretion system secreted protein Hcp